MSSFPEFGLDSYVKVIDEFHSKLDWEGMVQDYSFRHHDYIVVFGDGSREIFRQEQLASAVKFEMDRDGNLSRVSK
jgi:hypothetical protein